MTRLHTYSPSQLRVRAVQDVIYTIVFALGATALLLSPPPWWSWAYMVMGGAGFWMLVDLMRVLETIQRRNR